MEGHRSKSAFRSSICDKAGSWTPFSSKPKSTVRQVKGLYRMRTTRPSLSLSLSIHTLFSPPSSSSPGGFIGTRITHVSMKRNRFLKHSARTEQSSVSEGRQPCERRHNGSWATWFPGGCPTPRRRTRLPSRRSVGQRTSEGFQIGGHDYNRWRFRSHQCHEGGTKSQAQERPVADRIKHTNIFIERAKKRVASLQQDVTNGVPGCPVPCNFASELAQLTACVAELQLERDDLRAKLQNSSAQEDRERKQPRTLASSTLDLVPLNQI